MHPIRVALFHRVAHIEMNNVDSILSQYLTLIMSLKYEMCSYIGTTKKLLLVQCGKKRSKNKALYLRIRFSARFLIEKICKKQ